jgi:hypothetical protein
MPLTNGSRSGFGSGSAIFVIDHQVANKKQIFVKFFCLLLFEGKFTSFLKEQFKKESQNCRNQDFSYYFCLLIEGSGSGSIRYRVPLTNGSGSGSRPKNLRIRRIRIRIRNTAVKRNIHIRDKLGSDKINTKNLGRWLDLEICSHTR